MNIDTGKKREKECVCVGGGGGAGGGGAGGGGVTHSYFSLPLFCCIFGFDRAVM